MDLPPDDETSLRDTARELIATGRFPERPADRVWGGPGTGAACAICRQPVREDETEFELEFFGEGHAAGTYQLHARCFAAWDGERARRARSRGGGGNGALTDTGTDGTVGRRERGAAS